MGSLFFQTSDTWREIVTNFRSMSWCHRQGGNLNIRYQSLEKYHGYEHLLHWLCWNQSRTQDAHMKVEMLDQKDWPTKVITPTTLNYSSFFTYPFPYHDGSHCQKREKKKRCFIACLCPIHFLVTIATTL